MVQRALKGAATFAFVLLIFAYVLWRNWLEIVHPYTWDDELRREATDAGWELAIEYKSSDLGLPWTWVRPTTASMAFVRRDGLVRSDDGVSAELVWFHRESDGHIEQDHVVSLFDCRGLRFTNQFLPDDPWREMSPQMQAYFCPGRSAR